MKFIQSGNYLTGVASPLSALVSPSSCGCGEFFDLVPLARWCKKAGFNLIQILPIHDTGLNPSPYSALNAFALNPVYINLDFVEGSNNYRKDIEDFKKSSRETVSISYKETYQFKMEILRKIYSDHHGKMVKQRELHDWIARNEWIGHYSAYKILSEINDSFVWSQWTSDPVYNEDSIIKTSNLEKFLHLHQKEYDFYVYIQFELDKQLTQASRDLDYIGINLKGDLPVLMDKESSDVWYFREYFKLDFIAGAPPDYFSEKGQNWGFPVYNLETMHKDQFSWWKKRIQRLNRFFHALRLDHVIGYMRFWQIPKNNNHAGLGYFSPAWYIYEKTFAEFGFSIDEMNELNQPAINSDFLRSQLTPEEFENFQKKFIASSRDNLLFLTESITTELEIDSLEESEKVKNLLRKAFVNRALILTTDGFAPAWSYEQSEVFQKLPREKQDKFRLIVRLYFEKSEDVWFNNGKNFLSVIISASECLLCGEDLGAVPKTTAVLLERLGILSLKVLRWTRKYDESGAPYIPIETYPYRSVGTTSVHDSENLREWWTVDPDGRNQLYHLIKGAEKPPETLDPQLAYDLLEWFLKSSSHIIVIPLQDLFSTSLKYRIENPSYERINIPGTIRNDNWNYKIPVLLDTFLEDHDFMEQMQKLASVRQNLSDTI